MMNFIVTDVQEMRESGEVHVDSKDVSTSDYHFLVWLELGRAAKCYRKCKCTMWKWCKIGFV